VSAARGAAMVCRPMFAKFIPGSPNRAPLRLRRLRKSPAVHAAQPLASLGVCTSPCCPAAWADHGSPRASSMPSRHRTPSP
jgi:hypothetical protein